jgi:predicted nucleic acid-binding protein
MASKIFVDTNIILDIILEREPFLDKSKEVVSKIIKGNSIPYISSSSITDFYYICKRTGIPKNFLLEYLEDLMEVFEVLIIDKNTITDAISSKIKDFEDAVQLMACKKEKIDIIITRNKKDFQNEWIKVLSPEEYLK